MTRTRATQKRWIIGGVAAFTAAGLAGGAAAAAATAVGAARPARLVSAVSAQTGNPVAAEPADPSTTTSPATGPSADPAAPAAAPTPRVNPEDAAIDALVADGTLTKEQGDKVKAAIDAARPAHPNGPGGRGPGGRGPGRGGPGAILGGLQHASQAVADAIGITPDDLRTELQAGKSLADIATAHGKTAADVTAVITKEATTRLDAEVAAGHLTQAEADAMLAKAKTAIDALVTTPFPFHLRGMGKGAAGMPPVPPAPTTSTTTN